MAIQIDKRYSGSQQARHRKVVKSADKRSKVYRRSFGDLEPGTLYRDPLGLKTGGKPVSLQKEWARDLAETEVDWNATTPGTGRSSILAKWNELQRKGFGVQQTTDIIAKALDTGDWQLPLDILADVFIIQPEQTPFAEFIPRRSTQDDVVHATPETDQPTPEFGLEDPDVGTNDEGDAVYAFDDPDYEDLAYEVLGYGVGLRTSDQMILAARNLRNPEATLETAAMTGHRQKTERQIIWGTDATAPADGDADGWEGFAQFGETNLDPISEADTDDPDEVREYTEDLIDTAEEEGAPLENIAVGCGFDWHRTLRRSFNDLERYESAEDLDVGFATFAMEGGQVPVFKTNAIPGISDYPDDETNPAVFAVNMASIELSVLGEPTVQPLAKLGPEERFAVDQYNVQVSESGDGDDLDASHIQVGEVDVPA